MYNPNVRKNTNKLLEMIDEELLDARTVAQMALNYMSEAEVTHMVESNDVFAEAEE